MAEYVLSCCSTADLSREHLERRGISFACFHFSVNGKQYRDDLGESYPLDAFYRDLENGAETTTSQVNVEDFQQHFAPILEQGKDILHICLSSGLSGVGNAAHIAREELAAKFPERRIEIVDSLCASSGYGLLMDRLADLRDEGKTLSEVRDFALENRLRVNHWFFSADLTAYVKGGRISKAAGWFGTALNICPLLNMNREGRLVPRQKLRGKGKAIKEIVARMELLADGGTDYAGKVYLSHSACREDAEKVAQLVKERFPHIDGEPEIHNVGTAIGSHTGPGTVALFFWGKERGE